MTEYEKKIDEILEKREALAQELGEIMKMKEIHNIMQTCKDEGHIWTIVNVQSNALVVENISLICTRCEGNTSTKHPSETGGWLVWYNEYSQTQLKEMMGMEY
jgi:hypothetical protein